MEQLDRYDHVIKIDERTRELSIYRIDSSGSLTLFTKVALPATAGWSDEFSKFSQTLGENILLDSPSARRLLEL